MSGGEEQAGWEGVLTAEGRNGRVDGLDEDALAVELFGGSAGGQAGHGGRGPHTSSHDFASSRIQPSSMTSAESLVT
jgi:hypothetical protein